MTEMAEMLIDRAAAVVAPRRIGDYLIGDVGCALANTICGPSASMAPAILLIPVWGASGIGRSPERSVRRGVTCRSRSQVLAG